jgi:hypothetical protein
MQEQGLSRLVSLTSAGVTWPGDSGGLRLRTNRITLALMERSALSDADAHLQLRAASGLDWTCVRAPGMRPTGKSRYRLSLAVPTFLGSMPGPAPWRAAYWTWPNALISLSRPRASTARRKFSFACLPRTWPADSVS